MSKHTNADGSCPLCMDKLKDAHPDLQRWFIEDVKPRHQDCHISWSFRGKEDQNQAHAEGKSQLSWPMSAHNKSDDQGNPCAMALDFFELCSNSMARWAYKYFKAISEEAKEMGVSIAWGGDFKTISDSDHFELILPVKASDIV